MDQELKAKWVAALRSGDYTQGKSNLRNIDGGVTKHCCLGVLCEISPPEPVDGPWHCWGIAPFTCQWTGIALDANTATDLSTMNDQGKSFSEIADYIEAKL